MANQIQHYLPSLKADINGVLDNCIALFRGLPYATVGKRWTHSRVAHELESPFNATEYGPRCSQSEGQVLVSGGVNDPTPVDDEFRCLNLNVAVPQDELKTGLKLPVMVWIHGGAFNYGANSVARYRPQRLCQLAKADGNPMVLVQIQYRLGPLGFAASNDLATEQTQTNGNQNGVSEPSLLGNYGLVDQIHALEWVRDHISDFNGDPNNVTVFGISAGSASIHNHILTGNPLFDRAILMSGSAPTITPLPLTLYEQAWQNFIAKASPNAVSLTPRDRLQQVRALSPEAVIQHYTSAALGPLADGTLLPSNWQYTEKQAPTRCKSIIIGDTHIEAIIMDGLIRSIKQDAFENVVRSLVADASGFLRAFGFHDGMDGTAYHNAMRTWLSVGMFQYPHVLVANTFPGAVYYYHFDEPSPYPGPTFGLSYHGQCALFAYQNDTDEYSDEARNTAQTLGHIWTAFGSGKKAAPWEEYAVADRFMRFGPYGKHEMRSWGDDEVRSYPWMDWVKANYKDLKTLVLAVTNRV